MVHAIEPLLGVFDACEHLDVERGELAQVRVGASQSRHLCRLRDEGNRPAGTVPRGQHSDAHDDPSQVLGCRRILASAHVIQHAIGPGAFVSLAIHGAEDLLRRDVPGRQDEDALTRVVPLVMKGHGPIIREKRSQ